MNLLHYTGCIGQVKFDADERALPGRVIGINDVIAFESDSAAEAEREFRASVDAYIEHCTKIGKEPARPFSGRYVVRTTGTPPGDRARGGTRQPEPERLGR